MDNDRKSIKDVVNELPREELEKKLEELKKLVVKAEPF